MSLAMTDPPRGPRPDRPDRPDEPAARPERTIGIRCSAEYSAWLDRLAREERMPISVLFDIAIARWASRRHHDPPPRRTMRAEP